MNILKLVSLTLFSTGAGAVQAVFYEYMDFSCRYWLAACTNVPQNSCCYIQSGWYSHSARFLDTPVNSNWGGIAYLPVNGNQCGLKCGSTNRDNQCMHCIYNEYAADATGLKWFYITGKREEPQAEEDCEKILVDKVNIDNRVFEVNYDVPKADSDALLELAHAKVSISGVPEHLLQYEVPGDDLKESIARAAKA